MEKYKKVFGNIVNYIMLNNLFANIIIYIDKKGDIMKPKVSIIIPLYNKEKYIDECLNSIIANF